VRDDDQSVPGGQAGATVAGVQTAITLFTPAMAAL
jgi:hypothetical protein